MKYNTTNKSPKIFICISTFVFIIYLSCLIYLTLFAEEYGRGFVQRGINIAPLKTVMLYLTSPYNNTNNTIMNIAGNIVAFMPMGFLLPISTRFKNFTKVIIIVLIATICIETLQYIIGAGVADIDDVILNTLGGVMGYIIYKIFVRLFFS